MARPVKFPGASLILAAPSPAGEVQALPVFANSTITVSCWDLSAADRAAIDRDGRIWVVLLSGGRMFVGTEEDARTVVADYAPLWPRIQ